MLASKRSYMSCKGDSQTRAGLQACIATITVAPCPLLLIAVAPPEAYAALLLPAPRQELKANKNYLHQHDASSGPNGTANPLGAGVLGTQNGNDVGVSNKRFVYLNDSFPINPVAGLHVVHVTNGACFAVKESCKGAPATLIKKEHRCVCTRPGGCGRRDSSVSGTVMFSACCVMFFACTCLPAVVCQQPAVARCAKNIVYLFAHPRLDTSAGEVLDVVVQNNAANAFNGDYR